MSMYDKVYLDVSILKCPRCGKLYADCSWYVVDLESDIACSICGKSFNSKRNIIDRVLIEFKIRDGRAEDVKIIKYLPIKD